MLDFYHWLETKLGRRLAASAPPPPSSADPAPVCQLTPGPVSRRRFVLIADLWRWLFRVKPPREPPLTPPPQSAPDPELEAEIESEPYLNRHQRRLMKSQMRKRYERRRKMFDKFVEPQGPKPVTPVRLEGAPPRPKPDLPQPQIPDEDHTPFIVDVTHVDRKTKVLYESTEIIGQFNFRDTILDQLDRYFFYLNRMQKFDADAYHLYRQQGGVLLPYLATPDIWRSFDPEDLVEEKTLEPQKHLTPWFLATRPAFGCVAYGTSPEIEKLEVSGDHGKWQKWIPKFIYFQKYDRRGVPCELQPIRRAGDIYKLTVWWDRQKSKYKWGKPDDFGIFVAEDGHIEVLKQIETHLAVIRSKKRGDAKIPQRVWCIPHHHEQWAERHHSNAQRYVSNLFVETTKHWEGSASTMAKISVSKDELFACFGVDIRRLPYFFKDRDYVLNKSGTRRAIVHLVRPHHRNGAATATKMQVRGDRHFTWAGYNVDITIPALDHVMWEEFSAGAFDGRKLPKEPTITMQEVGRLIRETMK